MVRSDLCSYKLWWKVCMCISMTTTSMFADGPAITQRPLRGSWISTFYPVKKIAVACLTKGVHLATHSSRRAWYCTLPGSPPKGQNRDEPGYVVPAKFLIPSSQLIIPDTGRNMKVHDNNILPNFNKITTLRRVRTSRIIVSYSGWSRA